MGFSLKRGLSDIYAAEITADSKAAYTTDTPFHLIPAGEMSRTTATDKTVLFFDNIVFATVGKEEATEITITGASLRPGDLAKITNKYVDPTGVVIDDGNYIPKYFALGGTCGNIDLSGTSPTGDSSKEKFWFLKGTFSIPDQNDKTKDDTTDTNGTTLVFSAIPTKHKFTETGKPCKRVVIDTITTSIQQGESWEAQVVTPDNVEDLCAGVL